MHLCFKTCLWHCIEFHQCLFHLEPLSMLQMSTLSLSNNSTNNFANRFPYSTQLVIMTSHVCGLLLVLSWALAIGMFRILFYLQINLQMSNLYMWPAKRIRCKFSCLQNIRSLWPPQGLVNSMTMNRIPQVFLLTTQSTKTFSLCVEYKHKYKYKFRHKYKYK